MRSRLMASFSVMVVIGFAAAVPAQDTPAPTKSETPAEPAKDKDADKTKEKDAAKETDNAKAKPKRELATFGGGCFWCAEAVFERIPGVKNVVSGYSGGTVPNPSYEEVCTGLTGHAEVIQIEFDPSIIPYDKLLTVFWRAHDPTTLNQQEDDFGTNYRSIILYHSEAQRLAALKSYQDLKARRAFRNPIVTELVPFKAFYPAELKHQNYYNNHKGDTYSDVYIVPKLRKLKLPR